MRVGLRVVRMRGGPAPPGRRRRRCRTRRRPGPPEPASTAPRRRSRRAVLAPCRRLRVGVARCRCLPTRCRGRPPRPLLCISASSAARIHLRPGRPECGRTHAVGRGSGFGPLGYRAYRHDAVNNVADVAAGHRPNAASAEVCTLRVPARGQDPSRRRRPVPRGRGLRRPPATRTASARLRGPSVSGRRWPVARRSARRDADRRGPDPAGSLSPPSCRSRA